MEWYRQPWPWVLILIPLSAVAFGIFMVTLAITYPDDLVVDTYYKEGMAINQSLEMDRRAQALDVSARMLSAGKTMSFDVRNVTDSAIVLHFYHVTDRSRDASLVLYPGEGQVYAASVQVPVDLTRDGIWYLEMRGVDAGWRLRKRVETPVTTMELVANE